MHLPVIIQDLAIILIVAAAMTLLFRAIRQPVVLGYIVAGFLVGPHFDWLPTVVDNENIKVWAEIGVIFLLFALGLEFSFKKLARVGAPASITALVEVAGMVAIGFLVGQAFAWNNMDSLFLGGILAISSTTIIIRAFDELEMKTRGFVRLVFGSLIVEDLVAILLMVLLSTIAVSKAFSGSEMAVASLKLGFFLVLWFVLGIFLIPSLLGRVRVFLKAETLLIISLGLCFLMVVLAYKVGFSPALGAFIMGSLLAETLESDRIEHLISPIKDLFGAIFFVSVGMLIDPQILVQYAGPIFVIVIVTIFGKLLTTMLGALLAGQSLRHSVQAGMSLAQIGEFSFIIAGLGLSLKVTSEFLYPIAISVSAITTFTTPYLIRSSDSVVSLLERKLPRKWLEALEKYRVATASVSQTSEHRTQVKTTLLRAVANGVVVVAIFLVSFKFLQPWLIQQGIAEHITGSLSFLLAFVCSIPFLWAIVGGRMSIYLWLESRFQRNLNEKENVEKKQSLPQLAPWDSHLVELRVSSDSPLIGKKLSELMIREHYGISIALIIRGRKTIPAPGRNDVLYPADILQVIGTDEQIQRFRKECEASAAEFSEVSDFVYGLQSIYVEPSSPYVNKTIRECGLREQTHGLVVGIEKKGHRTLNPDSTTRIEAGDVLWVVGDQNKM